MQIFLSLLIAVGASAQMNDLRPSDFARGVKLEIEKEAYLIDVAAPEALYTSVTTADASDVSFFNGRNEAIPYVLDRTMPKKKTIESPKSLLRLYPIYRSKSSKKSLDQLRIAKSKQGTIVSVGLGEGEDISSKEVIGTLVDASHLKMEPISLMVYSKRMPKNELIRVRVDGSDDLEKWQRASPGGVLATFQNEAQELQRNRVRISRPFKYYRLSWGERPDLQVDQVTALFNDQVETEEVQMNWIEALGERDTSKPNKVSYIYDLKGNFPIRSWKLSFRDPNSMASLKLYGSNKDNMGPWTPLDRANFFSFKEGESEEMNEVLQSEFHSLLRYRYLRVSLESDQASVGQNFPVISFGWVPDTLTFLARGEGPYLLAYGSALKKGVRDSTILKQDQSNERGGARILSAVNLSGDKAYEVPEPPKEYPWKTILLWGILILGVFSLFRMAIQLKKQMG